MADSGTGEECKHDEENGELSEGESEYEEEDSIYEVDKIVGMYKDGDKIVYRVRWKGYGLEDDTWEPRENLLTCEDLIDEYVAKEEKKKAARKAGRVTPPEKTCAPPNKGRHAPKRSTPHPKKKKKKKRKYEEEVPADEERRDRRVSGSTDDDDEENDITADDEDEDDSDGRGEEEKVDPTGGKQRRRKQRQLKDEEEMEVEQEAEATVEKEEEKKMEEDAGNDDDDDDVSTLKDPFWDQLEKGLIQVSFETDMYSKVKNRRALLDARREEQESKSKEDKKKKEKKKKKKGKKDKSKDKNNGQRKTKKMVNLEMLGSLESATKRTLMMSPSALDVAQNSANLYKSFVPSEHVLTIAELEEKSSMEKTVAGPGSGGVTPSRQDSGSGSVTSGSTEMLGTSFALSESQSSSSSSAKAHEVADTPESPPQEDKFPGNSYADFFGDLGKLDEKSEKAIDSHKSSDNVSEVPPTQNMDASADEPIIEPILTPVSPAEADRGTFCNYESSFNAQNQGESSRLCDSERQRQYSAETEEAVRQITPMPNRSPVLDKVLSNLPTPPEVEGRSAFNMLHSSSKDLNASESRLGSVLSQIGESHGPLFNMCQNEQLSVNKVQESNIFEKAKQAVGNVQTEATSMRDERSSLGEAMHRKSQESFPIGRVHPPTPPASSTSTSLFSAMTGPLPKPSPLMPLSDSMGTPKRAPDLIKSPLGSPTTTHIPGGSIPQGVLSPRDHGGQKSPHFPAGAGRASGSGDRNAFEKLQSFQLSSAYGRNSAKVQSLKDKLSKLVSPARRKDESSSLEKGIGEMNLDQRQMSELRVDINLANAYKSEVTPPCQAVPLAGIERHIQRIDTRAEAMGTAPPPGEQVDRSEKRQREDSVESVSRDGGHDPTEVKRSKGHEDSSETEINEAVPPSNWTQNSGALATYENLCQAIKTGNVQMVVHLLQQSGPRTIEESDMYGTTPLMVACTHNQDEIVKALILNGAIVNKSHKNGMTPLMMAAEKGFTSTLAILLETGAHVNTTTPTGETALMQACRRGHKDAVRLLLEFGANWMVTGRGGSSALGYALHHNHLGVRDALNSHVQRLSNELEATASQFLYGTAHLLKPVFPLHCYRLREATEHVALVSFDPTNYYCYQGCGMLLLLAQATLGPGWSITCKLSGSSYIKQVLLNGRYLPQLTQGSNFVLSYTPRNGQNVLTISTVPDPYTSTLLLVGAYTVQIAPHTATH